MATELEATAYHEAGHAVMAFILKRRFSYVSIKPDEAVLGHIVLSTWPKSINPEIDSGPRVERHVQNSILISLAGGEAENLFICKDNYDGMSGDIAKAVNYAFYICGNDVEAERFVDWLLAKARNIMRVNWNAVEALATELLKKKKIGYVETRKIIKKAMGRRNSQWQA